MTSAAKIPVRMTQAFMLPSQQNMVKAQRSMFTWSNLIKNIVIITALIGINKAGTPGNAVFYAIICGLAMTSTENAIKALSIGVLALVSNSYFVEKSIVFSIGRFALIGVCFLRVFYDTHASGGIRIYRAAAVALGVFVVVAAILAAISNYFLTVSLLKLANFALGLYIILAGIEIIKKKSGEITCWMMAIISVVVLLGVASLVLGVGHNAKEIDGAPSVFFNGPFYHSNTLGPLGGMMVVYLVAIVSFTPYRLRWIAWPMIAMLGWFVLMTLSRTAVASCVAGVLALSFVAFIFSRRNGTRVRFNIKMSTLFVVGAIAVSILAIGLATRGDRVFDAFQSFVTKGGSSGGFYADEILASRQGQIDMTMYNFKRAPLTGIGFGTETTQGFQESAKWYSAPTEKGNLILALLEETGIPGFLSFFVFLIIFGKTLWQTLNAPAIGVFTTFFMVNMGEMMFFSFGGHGAFGWLLVGAALALGDRCIIRSYP